MINKYEKLVEDLMNIPQLSADITQMYKEEYDESFETILTANEGEFMRNLSAHVKSNLQELYSLEAFDNFKFVSLLKTIEKTFYTEVFLVEKQICFTAKEKFKNSSQPFDTFCFRKHCKYQDDTPTHSCNQANNFRIIYQPNESNEIFGVICMNCNFVYKYNYIKLYCNFSYVSYFSSLQESSNDNSIQPATWEKYHCNLILNKQMSCIKCKQPWCIDIKNNMLICFSCGFSIEPTSILWKCFKCGTEFHSGAKIYNPYEYKPIALAIKNAMYQKKLAAPEILKCGHASKGIKHKVECNGEPYIAYLNDRKMVLCSLCKALIKYEKFIWECPKCGERFRDDGSIKFPSKVIHGSLGFERKKYNVHTVSFSLNNTDDSHNDYIKKHSNSIKKTKKDIKIHQVFSPIHPSKKEDFLSRKAYSSKVSHKDDDSSNSSMMNNTTEVNSPIPQFSYDNFEIISQIGQGRNSKLFCAKEIESYTFYALKKEFYSSEEEKNKKLAKLSLQYSMALNNTNITKISYINISNDEISILEELAVNNWLSEITSKKKTKKVYTEDELVDIFYQISTAMESLQNSSYSHCNINTTNILIFKDKTYKLSDFDNVTDSLKHTTENQLMENKATSPNMHRYLYAGGTEVDLLKADVYSLALCGILTMLPSIDASGMIIDFVQNCSEEEEYIEKMIKKYMEYVNKLTGSEQFYSDTFVNLMCNMMNYNEKKRFNFTQIKEYIKKEYNLIQ